MKFLSASLWIVGISAAAAGALGRPNVENSTPGFLRHSTSLDGVDPSLLAKVPKDIGSLTVNDRAKLVATLAEEFEEAVGALEKIDLSEFPVFEVIMQDVKDAVERAQKPLTDVMHYLNGADDKQDGTASYLKERETEVMANGLTAPTSGAHRRVKEKTADEANEGHDWKKFFKRPNHHVAGPHAARHAHANKISDALLNGDQSFVDRMTRSLHTRTSASPFSNREVGRRNLQAEKDTHCEQLVECALTMSLYDLFVYYYSDDIDAATGQLDEIIEGFDETGYNDTLGMSSLQAKKATIDDIGAQLWPNFGQAGSEFIYDSTQCDNLLEHFHRSIEVNGNPEWEGAFVSQVCFAEGTQVFVNLEDIVGTLASNYRDLADLDDTSAYTGELLDLMEPFATEVIFCAEDLFNALNTGDSNESFPFARETYYREECCVSETNYTSAPTASSNSTIAPTVSSAPSSAPSSRPTVSDCTSDEISLCSGESLADYAFPYELSVDGRDEHGRIVDLSERYYHVQTYETITGYYNDCIEARNAEWSVCFSDDNEDDFFGCLVGNNFDVDKIEDTPFEECFKNINWFLFFVWEHLDNSVQDEFQECMTAAQQEVLLECLPEYTEPIQESIELVFGDRASTGFICGIKEAVINDGKSLPGRCCLNAPFQLTGDSWGYEYNCDDVDSVENACVPGPVLSGLNEDSCRVYGGKFCAVTDCTDLRDCVDDEIDFANSTGLEIYKEYLQQSPQIGDRTDDTYLCGRAREYFGFQESFINDNAICDDIQQLRYSNDFDFLNEFFNQGDKTTIDDTDSSCDDSDSSDTNVKCVPPIGLTDASRDSSGVAPATNGQLWRSTNFALSKAVDSIFFIIETFKVTYCPCDPTCIVENACVGVKSVLGNGLNVAKFVLALALDISGFTYGELAELGNIEPIETWENTNAIFPNMDTMATWLEERMKVLYFETSCREPHDLLPGHGCNGVVDICGPDDATRVPDLCTEDAYHPEIQLTRVEELCNPSRTVFPSELLAQQCVESHLTASDDCHPPTVVVTANGLNGTQPTCGSSVQFQIVATEADCSKSTTVTFDTLVDPNAISVCEFSQSPDVPPELDISDALELCSGKIFFPNYESAIACVEQHTVAKDDCREVELNVVNMGSVSTPLDSGCSTLVHSIEVTVNIKDCDLSTTETILVLVDPNVDHPSCVFDKGPDIDPNLDVSQAVESCEGEIYPTIAEAEACVLRHVVAEDAAGGCRPVNVTVDTAVVNGLCEYEITVTANIEDCDALVSISDPIAVIIDNEPPVAYCSLSENGVVDGVVDETGSGVLTLVPLEYSATENCKTAVKVQVEGFSNELEDFNAQEMLVMYEKPADGDNTKVGWYVAATICSTNSNGQCITDPDLPDTRFYKARVTATDQAGLTDTTECRLEIVAKNADASGSDVVPNQYFALNDFTHSDYTPDNA